MIVLKLTTPFDPGMYDQGNTYPHILITQFNMNVQASIIQINWEYGTFDATNGWVTGNAGMPQSTILQNDDYFAAIAATPEAGSTDSILMAAARECYEILGKEAVSAGEVVDIEPAAATSAAPTAKTVNKASQKE